MAQRTEIDLRELKDLIQSLDKKIDQGFVEVDKKIEALDKKVDKGFVEVDKKIEALDRKIDQGFVEVDKKIEVSEKKMEIAFADTNGKLDVINTRLTGIDKELKTLDVGITKIDTRLWAFGGFALTVSVGSLLTVFIRFMFLNNPKF